MWSKMGRVIGISMSEEEQEETEKKDEQQGVPDRPSEEPEIPMQRRPNWGLWLLLSVVVGVILLAFVFNDGIGVGTKKMELSEFEKEYRDGNIVLNDPQHFPVEVISNSGTTAGIIKAYMYREKQSFPMGKFYMPFTDSDEIKALCNRYGITATSLESADSPAPTEVPGADRVWSTEQFRTLGEEGRIDLHTPPVIYLRGNGSGVIVGSYRMNAPKKPNRRQVIGVLVNFDSRFQAEQIRTMLGNHAVYRVESNTFQALLINCIPVVLILLLFIFLFRMQAGGPNGAIKFAKSRARLIDPSRNKITFADVAGVSEAKEEVWELVEFLRNPGKFHALGGSIPKGILMVGPPGTGKTLLAKAIAGEAHVPFYTISGSDFMEMFVGVGASRVRDMFAEAKRNTPCLIFIDEIDAVGRHRGHGVGGGHDEREQTLNALLVEMDGFTDNENIIVIAATNRADVLDPALLRPGRFDRQVMVNLPDAAGREQILRVHARKIKLAPEVDLNPVARATTGFSGAELANLVNEAALTAVRRGHAAVTQDDFEEAREKVRWGRERRSMEITDREKWMTAVHEAGHAICLLKTDLSKTLPLHKVTIIPRGPALGVTMMLPDEDKHSEYKKELLDYIVMAMGGRCAEEVMFGDISGGARGDISQATSIARKMVCVYGMSEKLGPVDYGSGHDEVFLARDFAQSVRSYSESTAQMIDQEIRRIVEENYRRALDILTINKERLELIAKNLIEYETLSGAHVKELLETGAMADPPVRELPPSPPPASDAPTDLQTPDDQPPAPEQKA